MCVPHQLRLHGHLKLDSNINFSSTLPAPHLFLRDTGTYQVARQCLPIHRIIQTKTRTKKIVLTDDVLIRSNQQGQRQQAQVRTQAHHFPDVFADMETLAVNAIR